LARRASQAENGGGRGDSRAADESPSRVTILYSVADLGKRKLYMMADVTEQAVNISRALGTHYAAGDRER